jgi:hypothetical protein
MLRSGSAIHWIERDAVHAMTYLLGKLGPVLKARHVEADAGQSEDREEVAAQHVRGRLIGFDAREMWQEFHIAWSQERKENFLLRQDIKKPLSTDTMVWPSVFDEVGELAPPYNWRGSLWDGLEVMRGFMKARPITTHLTFWMIGITLVSGEFEAGQEEMGYPTLPALDLPAESEDWTLLGYDVSDHSLLSGLSNCGYLEREKQRFRKRWARHLNRYHLFGEVDPAVEFKAITDRRIPEHAPFFVYGLYLITKGQGAAQDEKDAGRKKTASRPGSGRFGVWN